MTDVRLHVDLIGPMPDAHALLAAIDVALGYHAESRFDNGSEPGLSQNWHFGGAADAAHAGEIACRLLEAAESPAVTWRVWVATADDPEGRLVAEHEA